MSFQGRNPFFRTGPKINSPSVIPIDIESNEAPEIPVENDLPEDVVESSIEPSPESPELEAADTTLEVAEISGEEADWDPLATEEIEVEEVLEDLTTDSSSLNSEQPAANSQEEETSEETTEITTETSSEVEPSLEVISEETESIDPVAESELEEDAIDPVAEAESELEEDAILAEADETDADTESAETTEDSEEEEVDSVETFQSSEFTSGVFTVGDTGEVTVDFLFDGGGYQGELAIFSLNGLEEFEPGSEEFIREAASRALSNSTSGYVVISDPTEGAKFTGELGEGNSNSGEYLGAKTFTMQAGDQFGFMLVANGRVQQVFDDPTVGGALRPLFSMATANPDDAFHVGQIADVTGNGNTFVMEDLRVDEWTDRDYNDLIFQVRGATGTAIHLDEVIDPARDWRESGLGEQLIYYIMSSDVQNSFSQPIQNNLEQTDSSEEQIIEFDQELWDFISSQENAADPLPEGVELPSEVTVTSPTTTTITENLVSISDPATTAPATSSSVTISINQAPVVSSANITLGLNESLGRYFFTAYDPDDLDPNMAYHNGGSIQQYYFQDVNTNSNSGYFTLNGVRQNGGFSLPASAIHNPNSGIDLKFFASSQSGVVDTIQVSAYDGKTWGNSGVINVSTTLESNRLPVITAYNQTISPGTSLSSNFFTTADPDGDTIQRYSFSDLNKSSNSGYFVINGQKQTGDIDFILASQLANVRYVAGSQGTAETIRLGAYDGKAWGYRDINVATQDKQYVVNNGGWWADYYQGDFQQYKGSEQLPDQAAWGKLFKSWGHGGPLGMTDNFSARLTGKRYFEPGQHLITAGADDRIRVRIDGKEIITAWAFGAPGKQVYFDSPGGYHTIEIDYKEDAVSAVVSLDWLLTKPLQANRAPVVTTTNRTLDTNTSIPVSNLFTFSDPDGDTIQTYHFGELDSTTTSGGYLTYKGVRLTGGRWVQVNASQLADVRFVAGPQAGSDRINIQVYDGKTWSNFTSVTLTTQQANRAPVVTTSNRTLNIGTSTAVSNFFTVTDPDGDTIQRYYFSDITSGSTSGYFMLNGVKQTSPFYADASQLANVQFVAGSQAGTDTVAIQAYDGKTWSNFPSATITTQQPNRAPVVTTTNQTLNTGTSIGTNFFTVSDPDGDAIQQYYFYDSNSSDTSGYFTVNGIKQTGTFFVSSNQLASVRFVAGLQAGTDTVHVQASDGKAWSNFPGTTITTQQANRAPVVTTTNRTLDTGTSTAVSNFFTVSDADGDTIQRYYFSDGTSDITSGYFTLNGVRQTSSFYADASQLASVRFVAGSKAGTDTVAIQAYDGKAWSNFPSATITTTQKANLPPRVIPINRTINVGTTNNADFFTVSDPDGDAIQTYYFYDNNSSNTSGYFTINGVRQAAGFFVAASQLANVKFVGGSQTGSDSVTIYAYDGTDWSSGANSILTTQRTNRLPFINVSNQSVNANQSISLVFTATDPDGDAITRYQFWDSNTASSSGYFTVNGVRQPAGQAIEVAANQLNTVRFVGGSLAGSDSLSIRAFDNKDWSNWQNFSMATTASQNPQFTSFSVADASGDSTAHTVFQGGAIKFNYSLANSANLSSVRLEAVRNGSVIANLGTWNGASASNQLVNLANFPNLTGGDYQIRAVARTTSGQEIISLAQSMKVLSTNRVNGTFAGETLTYAGGLGTGGVIIGRGGTDTLNLSGISRSSVTGINGMSLNSFNSWSGSTNSQAIFGGNALDYITLADGREVYFQGIDRLRFSDGSEMSLQIRPNDTSFAQQWNLQITDVTSAWRFTQGSSNILLTSLDSGIATAPGRIGSIVDISNNRLKVADDDNQIDKDKNGVSLYNGTYGHGHAAVSVMASNANNGSGVAGINWNSDIIVRDVYGERNAQNFLTGVSRVSLFDSIKSSIDYARAKNQKVVFQGGVQGESWLNDGAWQADIEKLIRDNSDVALFAVAAGNGGPNGNLEDFNYLNSVSGFAKLETNHSNVISVGALKIGTPQPGWGNSGTDYNFVNGLLNASSVSLTEYSNRGSNLTLVAPTNSPAMTKLGDMSIFGGTSAANPNMAGIASLVWSVNSKLTGGEVRQILIDTAMDLGTAGRDNTFGNGLVNADAAVRRAWALQKDSQVANLYSGRSVIA